MASVDDIVLPGDVVTCFNDVSTEPKVLLGPGLRQETNRVVAIKPGILRRGKNSAYWVESHEKKYVPAKGDNVIGIVISKSAETFKLDIGASEPASLSYLAFEGASKRNRPDVKIDDIIYTRLIIANKDMEPELTCVNSTGKSGGLGVLRDGGFMVRTSVSLARQILSTDSPLLKALGKPMPYEFAVGLNGRIYVNGRSTVETLTIARAIAEADHYSAEEVRALVRRVQNFLTGV